MVGITALGLDHTSILGHTLPEIAATKAGIMKPGCVAYTVQQPDDAMDVLRKTADTVKVGTLYHLFFELFYLFNTPATK